MAVLLGAVNKPLQTRRVTFEEAEKWKTIKLKKIEYFLRQYFWSRADKKSLYDIYDMKGFIKIQNAWEKEVEKIMKKNNVFPDFVNWAYDVGDILA